jgi:hypothetical protein
MPTIYEVTATALNLRSAPSAGSTVLAVLRKGQACTGSGAASGPWLPVLFGSQSGWVYAAYVRGAGVAAAAEPAPVAPPALGLAPPATAMLPADPQARLRGMEQLHPKFRAALDGLLQKAAAEGRPFKLFEAFRTPERQRWLFEQGRSRPGSIVTKAEPWQSFHQYGLGADLVLFVNGQWTWSDAGPLGEHWQRLPSLAKEFGLRTLKWEAPHVEWPCEIQDATGPDLVASGDEDWADTLASAADRWRQAGLGTGPDLRLAQRPGLTVA